MLYLDFSDNKKEEKYSNVNNSENLFVNNELQKKNKQEEDPIKKLHEEVKLSN